MTARLLTIGVSHYCEKARWALDRAGVDYVEEAHAPLFHLRAGRGTRPIFIDGATVLGESTAILQHADAKLDERSKLYPATIGTTALALEEQYDATLGPDVRRVAYALLADEPELFARVGGVFASPFENRVLRAAPRLFLAPILRAYKIRRGPPPRAVARIEAAFAEASATLARQPFLAGDRFSAADLTFASLAAAVVFPERHPAMPAFDAIATSKAGAFMRPFRESAAGEHVVRMYRDFRNTRS